MNDLARLGKPLPTLERLQSLLTYDDDLGALIWLVNLGGPSAVAGRAAGTMKPDGYLSVMIDRKRYPAHRLIFKLRHGRDPVGFVDHVDGNRSNNRISNLREATECENAWNSAPHALNTSGHRGVYFYKRTGKWKAQIAANNRSHHIGYFSTKEDAIAAAEAALAQLHGTFAYGVGGQHG